MHKKRIANMPAEIRCLKTEDELFNIREHLKDINPKKKRL